ncbi:MAG: nucleotide sugar dehydrogenase, partial [Deltaproteobacteria bacterium]|nr:nucleotide sugar dehydrogenase [Deltaproteobacteria bacterium]
MKIAVLGLWHLGTVTACGAAHSGHFVTGWDRNPDAVTALMQGQPPLFEPGLAAQLLSCLANGTLSFTSDLTQALKDAEVIWITHDTPVDDRDVADCESVLSDVRSAIPLADPGAVILISSQLPAGTARQLLSFCRSIGRSDLEVAVSPENLRLGQALAVFSNPDRVVCGVYSEKAKKTLTQLWTKITDRIEWMGVESAEMTKHAINAFLATSVCFANELAALCEVVGADAKEVERGLKSESRIGPGAYLGPGPAYAGGTLARDLTFLTDMGRRAHRSPLVMEAAMASNDRHKNWAIDRLAELLQVNGVKEIKGKKVALWGLAYKPGTDTLRRSSSLETAKKITDLGALVIAHDPAIKSLPAPWKDFIGLASEALEAIEGAEALVICTSWPNYLSISADDIISRMSRPLILDPAGFLRPVLGNHQGLEYVTICYR